jgi:HSP20 family protein
MANLVRWDPFGEMWSLRQAMDRLFEDAVVRPGSWLATARGEEGAIGLAVDMYETADDVVVTASVPGVRPEDIDITVQGDTLTIKGETQTEKDDDGQSGYHLHERRYGRFYREVALPKNVKSDAAEAHFENGILRLRLPKAEEAKERKIQVQAGSAPQITGTAKDACFMPAS